jgi:hypothetical protein
LLHGNPFNLKVVELCEVNMVYSKILDDKIDLFLICICFIFWDCECQEIPLRTFLQHCLFMYCLFSDTVSSWDCVESNYGWCMSMNWRLLSNSFFFTTVNLHYLEMDIQILIFLMQWNYFNLTCMWLGRCQIIDYSRISDGTYTDVSSYR